MSVVPVARPAALPSPARAARAVAARSHVGRVWWLPVVAILLGNLMFHSNADPSDRLGLDAATANLPVPWFHTQMPGGFTPGDLLVLAFAGVAAARRIARREDTFSSSAVQVTLVVTAAIAAGVAVGMLRGSESLLGDWRNLVVGGLFMFALWSTVLRRPDGLLRFAQVFVAVTAAYGALQLVEYAQGGGDIAQYGRTPVGDHAALEFMVACVAVSLAMLHIGRSRNLWLFGLVIGTSIVVLSFRRYAWIELLVVGVVLMAAASGPARRRYVLGVLGVALVACAGIALTWSTLAWGERLESLDPRTARSSNALAATNQGHLDDILDGLDQVRDHPLLGLGVGVTWVGGRTFEWKGETSMVHNGPVMVWIKFGLAGVALYVVLYGVLLVRLWRRRRGRGDGDALAVGAGAFLLGNFLITLTVYPWPFVRPESAVLVCALVAAALASRAHAADRPATPAPVART